jgi:hypothetical protein
MDIHLSGRIDVDEAEFCFVMSQGELATLSATLERADEIVTVVTRKRSVRIPTIDMSDTVGEDDAIESHGDG